MPNPITSVWPGKPFPQGATWDGEGVNFALFSEHAEGVELCLFDSRGRRELQRIPLREQTDQVWHCYLPEARPGPAVRLSRARPYQPQHGHRFNPQQAAARSLCQGDRRRARAGATRTSAIASAVSAPTCRTIGATTRAACRSARSSIRRSRGATTATRARRGTTRSSTRCTCAASPSCIPRCRRSIAARTPGSARRRSSSTCKRLGVTAVELMPVHSFVNDRHLVEKGLQQLLGLQLDRLLRAAPGLRLLAAGGPRVQDDGQGAALGRHRGDPRRRLQPHRRRQPPRPDAVLPRHRQRRVLPPGARRPALLHGLHRLRQHAEHAASARAAAHHGQPALLDHRDARRRLPLRPRRGAGARAARGRPARRVLRHHSPGPGDLAGEADRRAVGPRRGRLPGRPLPGRLDRVERQVPRRDPRLLERRGRPDRRARLSRRRLERPVRAQRPPAVCERQLRHRARRLHAARPRQLQRQAQRGEQRRQPRRREPQPQLELRRRGTDRRSGDPRAAAAPERATCSRRCCCRRACRCCSPATSSVTPSRATTTPTARTTS